MASEGSYSRVAYGAAPSANAVAAAIAATLQDFLD